jgi:quercetin dioxygenase-like cupin family protein
MTTAKTLLLALAWSLPICASALDGGVGVKITPVLKTGASWNGAAISYPAGKAEITGLLLEIAPGGETGWHKHPVPSFGMVLEGTLEVRLKDGKTRRVNAGEAIAEVVDTWHNGRNVGGTPLKLVVFYAGAADTPLTVWPQ